MTTQGSFLADADAVAQSMNLRVLRADKGFESPLHELIRSTEEPPLLWSIDARIRLVKRRMTGGIAMRHQEDAHSHGWNLIGELSPKDRIAVVRRIGEPIEVHGMLYSEVIMLAHMIGDGSCIKRQPVRYASYRRGQPCPGDFGGSALRGHTKTSQARLYYASTNRRRIDDVMRLLLRVGVSSRILRCGRRAIASAGT